MSRQAVDDAPPTGSPAYGGVRATLLPRMLRRALRRPRPADPTGAVMTAWHDHLDPLDQGPQTWTSRQRVEQLLAGESVEQATATTVKDVCDDGHVHTDVTLGLLTPTRLIHVVVGDAQHVTDEHELGLQCAITSVPLVAVTDVAVLSWDQQGTPAVEVRVARAGGAWQAVGDVHDCGDPECEIPPGSIQLEARTDGVVLFATGDEAEVLNSFAGHLARAAGTH